MIYKTQDTVFYEKQVVVNDAASFPVLTFAAWENLPGVRHCFTTRAGGVSEGWLSSLNFRRGLYDPDENIVENFRRTALFFNTTPDRIVCAQQTHTCNVRIVTEADAGKGVTRERDYTDVDGLITDVSGLILFTSHADCVPIYFYDPVRRVIALAHSGWKGTAARIGQVTVRKMQKVYGCRPQDIYTAVGPSICSDCYEVSEDVAEAMRVCFSTAQLPQSAAAQLPQSAAAEPAAYQSETGRSETAGSEAFQSEGSRLKGMGETIPGILEKGRRPGKYQLDLWRACERILLESGITPEHITVSNLCTCENSTGLFSHRATGGKRGNQGAFLMLC
jgi:YfiH family protein